MERLLYKWAIMFSGTQVTMPAKTPHEHGQIFYEQAQSLGVSVKEKDSLARKARAIAEDLIRVDVGKIRDLGFVGAPCTNTKILPYDQPTMSMMRQSKVVKKNWVEAQIISTTTYDGGISFNMIARNPKREHHAQSFSHIAYEVLGT
jgi:hypothetical protein